MSPQIDLEPFEEDAAVAFFETGSFGSHWKTYQPALCVLEERLGSRKATLRHGEIPTSKEFLTRVLGTEIATGYKGSWHPLSRS